MVDNGREFYIRMSELVVPIRHWSFFFFSEIPSFGKRDCWALNERYGLDGWLYRMGQNESSNDGMFFGLLSIAHFAVGEN